jgi:hypothetical protein
MRGPFRESELVEAPHHQAEIGFSCVPGRHLPASEEHRAATCYSAGAVTPGSALFRLARCAIQRAIT